MLACMHLNAKMFSQRVSLNLKNASLEVVFKEIKKQTSYEFNGETIKITEKVLDENGKPVVGVIISVKKKYLATYTDGKGEFFLNNVDKSGVSLIKN